MISKRMYVLIGNDEKRKIRFQEKLIGYLCENNEQNQKHEKRKLKEIYYSKNLNEIFFSIDELQSVHENNQDIKEYVNKFCEDRNCDLWIISSKPNLYDIEILIKESHSKFLNVTGVFFEEDIDDFKEVKKEMSKLSFDERIVLTNSVNKINNEHKIEEVIGNEEYICQDFANMLLIRSYFM